MQEYWSGLHSSCRRSFRPRDKCALAMFCILGQIYCHCATGKLRPDLTGTLPGNILVVGNSISGRKRCVGLEDIYTTFPQSDFVKFYCRHFCIRNCSALMFSICSFINYLYPVKVKMKVPQLCLTLRDLMD